MTDKLELNKILQRLSEYTSCEEAKERVLGLTPSTNVKEVEDLIAKTSDAYFLSSRYGTPPFFKMENPKEHLKLAQVGGVLNPKCIMNIASILRGIRAVKDWYGQCENVENSLSYLFQSLYPAKELEKRINQVFISEDEIADTASDQLYAIRKKIKSLGDKIKGSLDKMLHSATYQKALQENIVTMRDGRYVLPVKAEYKGLVSGLVHDTSSSGATLFIEPMSVVESNNEIKVQQGKERDEIEQIIKELSAMCGEHSGTISAGFEVLIELNIIFAKGNMAADMRATVPHIVGDGKIKLNKARHPLIDKDKVVPITVSLGYDYTSLVITGPNTGGKTVTLKTIGLLTQMAMCGMLIPAGDDSVISVFDDILADMGDAQSIAQNLSTFSAHMTNIVSILNKSTNKTLILLDELGSGTDPVEGAAIATAILEKLRLNGSIVAATTHYAELKVYALNTQGVKNASCEFDVKTLKPTYRLLVGTPGRSNAFEISRKLGLSEDILQSASKLIANDKKTFEDVIDSLESARQDFESKSALFEKQNRELAQLKEELKNSNADAIADKERIIEKAHQEARKIVDNVKLDSQLILDELEKIRKEKDKENFSQLASAAKAQMRGKIDKLHDIANPVIERTNEDYILPRPLKLGDEVLIVDINKQGTVVKLADKSGMVTVQTGIIKSKVAENLLRLEDKKKQKVKGNSRVVKTTAPQSKMELDLRGMSVDEAIAELDMFVSRCMLSNIGMVTIIHGKGTGMLRSAVHSYLKRTKQVKSYRLGLYGEGESGVTIVEF